MQIRFDPRRWFQAGPTGSSNAAASSDYAVHPILASNLLTLAIAWWQGWGLLHLLWPFWIQSVVIGWYSRQRILALQEFSTEGVRINNRSVEPTVETKHWTANFFALHFGFFHLVYLIFLLVFTSASAASGMLPLTDADSGKVSQVFIGRIVGADLIAFALIGLAFACSHRFSHREHLSADLARRPNIGTLMLLPYARVVPMHLCVIVGMALPAALALWLFAALKIAADLVMHKVEHAWLARGGRTR